MDSKNHWEQIYRTKNPNEVSWYQQIPSSSLQIFRRLKLPKTARIIDVGGGDSLLADHLLEQGFSNITVLDVSETAIEKAKRRLGNKASDIKWIIADVLHFQPEEKYDVWHDRAAFHFLINNADIKDYIRIAYNSLNPGGILSVGTFSIRGPEKCSGLPVKQYSSHSITVSFKELFRKIRCFYIDHRTPRGVVQNFIFCSFKKVNCPAAS